MSPSRWFTDAPILAKMLLAPAVIVILMVTMGVIASQAISKQGRALSEFGQVLLPRTNDIDLALQLATDVHVDLFRAVTWAANSDEASKVATASDGATKALDELQGFLSESARRWHLSDSEKRSLDDLLAEVTAYRTASAAVLKMAVVDPATSFIMVLQAEKRFSALRTHLVALREGEAASTRHTIDTALQADHAAYIGFTSLLAAAALVGGLVVIG